MSVYGKAVLGRRKEKNYKPNSWRQILQDARLKAELEKGIKRKARIDISDEEIMITVDKPMPDIEEFEDILEYAKKQEDSLIGVSVSTDCTLLGVSFLDIRYPNRGVEVTNLFKKKKTRLRYSLECSGIKYFEDIIDRLAAISR